MYTIVVLICSAVSCNTAAYGENGVTKVFTDLAQCEKMVEEQRHTIPHKDNQYVDAQCVSWFQA